MKNQDKVRTFYLTKTGRDNVNAGVAMDRFIEEMEEFYEAVLAVDDPNEHELKEMADVMFTLYGYASARGYDLDEAFERIYQSNMTKEKTPEGKVRKGPNYVEPNLADCVKESRTVDIN